MGVAPPVLVGLLEDAERELTAALTVLAVFVRATDAGPAMGAVVVGGPHTPRRAVLRRRGYDVRLRLGGQEDEKQEDEKQEDDGADHHRSLNAALVVVISWS